MISNKEEACDILGIPYNFTEKELKAQYKKMALKYHPDKNKHHNNRFILIKEAYEYLSDNVDTPIFRFNDYYDLLHNFLHANHINIDIELLYTIIHKLFTNKMDKILSMFHVLSYNNGIKIYQFLQKYNELFDIDQSYLDSLYSIIHNKTKKESNIYHIFHPTMDDLFLHNIFKYTYLEEDYYIPSWHEEVHFRLPNHTLLILKCIPILPKHITIDNDNNIHYTLVQTLSSQTLKEKQKFIPIGKHKRLALHFNTLFIKETQCIKYLKEGIPKIVLDDTYNNTDISTIYIHLHLQ